MSKDLEESLELSVDWNKLSKGELFKTKGRRQR